MLLGSPAAASGPPSAEGSVLPGHPGVISEYMRVTGAQAAGTPDVLNVVNFLRIRRNTPGLAPTPADAVLIAQPGFTSVPGIWLEVAAQLVEKAGERECQEEDTGDIRPCNVEVWVIDRRGSNMEDTVGLRAARVAGDPGVGLEYYYGPFILTPKGTFPLSTSLDDLLGLPGATFQPLEQDDVPFMSEWGFETAADDINALVGLLSKQDGGGRRNVFIAGHSQGGGFVSYWAGRRFDETRRGHDVAAGLIFLDGGPSIGATESPSNEDIAGYLGTVNAIRAGIVPRFGASLAGITLSTGFGVRGAVIGLYPHPASCSASTFRTPSAAASVCG
jgi:pimeloyl-ACP methyl ester carboxylesterase